jgi:hypothetical protein
MRLASRRNWATVKLLYQVNRREELPEPRALAQLGVGSIEYSAPIGSTSESGVAHRLYNRRWWKNCATLSNESD